MFQIMTIESGINVPIEFPPRWNVLTPNALMNLCNGVTTSPFII